MNTFTDNVKVLSSTGASPGPSSERLIGALLIDAGKLTPEDAERVLRYQRESGLRFGDAALKLRVITNEDIQQVLSKQFDYPYLVPGDSNVSTEVIAAWSPFSRQVEALRALRSQLLLRWFTGEAQRRSLAIVSTSRGEGRSYLAANLAVVFSQLGERTLLIDADLRHPRQHQLFGLSNATGLSTVLSGRTELDAISRIPSFVDLSVLPGGPIPPNPSELIGRMSFTVMLEAVTRQFDVVLLDTSSVSSGSDSQTVAVRTGGSLVVAKRNKSRLDDVAALVGAFSSSKSVIVGGVLNDA